MADSDSETGNKARKRPLGRRIGERARAVGLLGQELVNDPRRLPGKAHGSFRRWFRKVWDVRGGGLYACGFALTFAVLEVRDILSDVADFPGFGDLFVERLIEFVTRFAVDTLLNTLHAFIWPVYVLQLAPPFGAIGLGAALILFPRFLKKPIERWLFRDGISGSSC